MLDKKLIRKAMLAHRKQMPEAEYQRRNQALTGHLLKFLLQLEVSSVHLFYPIIKHKEPDVTSALEELWRENIQTVTSITDFGKRTMSHFAVDASTVFSENHLGIPEPQNGIHVAMNQVEAILVPLVLADKVGNRVGYGGGFYDQLLKETKAIKIGLCLSNPVDKIIQTDDWDIPLNYLITPYKHYTYG